MSGPAKRPDLSICAPMYREQAIVDAFVDAVRRVADGLGITWELIIADDASPDDTLVALHRAQQAEPRLHIVALPHNRGQLGATQAALAEARGRWVAVLDGDLQDPPEVLAAMWRRASDEAVDAVFAVKRSRDDAAWLRLAVAGYRCLQRWFAACPPPSGAGSFVMMRAAVARRLASLDAGQANLAPLVAAIAPRSSTVPYAKAARYDGVSRVGVFGLVREAWGALVLSRAAERLSLLVICCGLAALVANNVGRVADGRLDFVASAVTVSAITSLVASMRRRMRLGPLDPLASPQPPVEQAVIAERGAQKLSGQSSRTSLS